MVKREDPGSGLRAGFVRGDGLMQQPRKKEKPRQKEEEPEIVKQPPIPEPVHEPEEPAGPTLTMQGVSGKMITGVVKVVKKVRRPADEPQETEPAKPEQAPEQAEVKTEKPAEPLAVPMPVQPTAAEAPAPAPAEKPEPAEKPVQAEKPAPVAERPAPVVKPAPVSERPAIQPQPRPVQPAQPLRPQGERPSFDRGPRPAPGRPAAPGPIGPGARPPRGPQSGQYLNRSAGQPARPPMNRGPVGGFDKDDDASAARPGTSQRPTAPRSAPPRGRLKIPGVPEEVIKEKPAETRSFKAPRREDKPESRDVRKDTVKTPAAVKDKHRTLKKQAQELSGKPVSDALSDEVILDTIYKEPAKSSRSRGGRNSRRNQRQPSRMVRAVLTHVKLPATLTVKEFAEAIKKTAAEVIKNLMKLGIMASLNQEIDFDTATLIAAEYGITTEQLVEVTEEDILFDDSEDADEVLVARPPVVVVMGHVDHGKTSILDRIRSASVASGEAGGITQHIGAYTVSVKNRQITFLDTPGHEAFTTMRARGAQVTDIAILVVAADDGVMPQTVEAINHARAANTQIVVAINKIDLPGVNIDRVRQELATHDLIPEDWGGSTVMVPVSAKTGAGMDELLEMVLLTADLMDLRSNPEKQAKGTVIEAKLDKNRGPVATVLVQRGTLHTGDTLVTGSIFGHIRAMTDDRGKPVKEAGPSIPVEVLGLQEVPEAGELFYAVTDEKVARSLADRRRAQQREQQLRASSRMTLDSLFSQMAAGEVKDLNIIVKADVQGSVEAVRQSLEKLATKEVRVNVIHGAVGAITETDVRLAEVSNAIVIGFNVRPAANVAELADEVGVDLRMYRIIYQAIEDIEAAMKGMLSPKMKEVVLGHAEIRQVFRVSGVGSVGGSMVTDGKIIRSCEVRVVRDGIVVHEGRLASLRRFKDDVREVAAGYECGIGLERFNDIKEGDVIEAFEMQEIEGG